MNSGLFKQDIYGKYRFWILFGTLLSCPHSLMYSRNPWHSLGMCARVHAWVCILRACWLEANQQTREPWVNGLWCAPGIVGVCITDVYFESLNREFSSCQHSCIYSIVLYNFDTRYAVWLFYMFQVELSPIWIQVRCSDFILGLMLLFVSDLLIDFCISFFLKFNLQSNYFSKP